MPEVENLSANITSDSSSFERSAKLAIRGIQELLKSFKGLDRTAVKAGDSQEELAVSTAKAGQAAQRTADLFGVADLALGQWFQTSRQVLTTITRSFIDFENAVVDTVKVVNAFSGQTLNDAPVQDFVRSIQQLGQTIPIANQELFIIGQRLSQLGFVAKSTADTIGDDLPQAIQTVATAASALGVSAEEAGAAFGIFRNLFLDLNQPAKQQIATLNRYSSVLNELQNNTAATSQFLFDFNRRVGATAKTVGLSFQEVSGFGAAVAQLGISAEVSGTALQAFFGKALSRAEVFANTLGETVAEFRQGFSTRPYEKLVEFLQALNQQAPAARSAILSQITNSQRAITVVNGLVNQTQLLTEATELGNKAYAENNSIQKEFALTTQTLGAEFQRLGNNLNTSVINGFTKVLGIFKPVLEFLNSFITTFPVLSSVVATSVVGIAALALAYTGIRLVLPKVRAVLAGVGEQFILFNNKISGSKSEVKTATDQMESDVEDFSNKVITSMEAASAKTQSEIDEIVAAVQKGASLTGSASRTLVNNAAAIGGPPAGNALKTELGDQFKPRSSQTVTVPINTEFLEDGTAAGRAYVDKLANSMRNSKGALKKASLELAASLNTSLVEASRQVDREFERMGKQIGASFEQGKNASVLLGKDLVRNTRGPIATVVADFRSGFTQIGTGFRSLSGAVLSPVKSFQVLRAQGGAALGFLQQQARYLAISMRRAGGAVGVLRKGFSNLMKNSTAVGAALTAVGASLFGVNETAGKVVTGIGSILLTLPLLKEGFIGLVDIVKSLVGALGTLAVAGPAVAILAGAVALFGGVSAASFNNKLKADIDAVFQAVEDGSSTSVEALNKFSDKASTLREESETFLGGIKAAFINLGGGFEDLASQTESYALRTTASLKNLSQFLSRTEKDAKELGTSAEEAAAGFRVLAGERIDEVGVDKVNAEIAAIVKNLRGGEIDKAVKGIREFGANDTQLQAIVDLFARTKVEGADIENINSQILSLLQSEAAEKEAIAQKTADQAEGERLVNEVLKERQKLQDDLLKEAVANNKEIQTGSLAFEAERQKRIELATEALRKQREVIEQNIAARKESIEGEGATLVRSGDGQLQLGQGPTSFGQTKQVEKALEELNALEEKLRALDGAEVNFKAKLEAEIPPLEQEFQDLTKQLREFEKDAQISLLDRDIAKAQADGAAAEFRRLSEERLRLVTAGIAREKREVQIRYDEEVARINSLAVNDSVREELLRNKKVENALEIAQLDERLANERLDSAEQIADIEEAALERKEKLLETQESQQDAILDKQESVTDAVEDEIAARVRLNNLIKEARAEEALRAINARQAAENKVAEAQGAAQGRNTLENRQAVDEAKARVAEEQKLADIENERRNNLRQIAEEEKRLLDQAADLEGPDRERQVDFAQRNAEIQRRAAEEQAIRDAANTEAQRVFREAQQAETLAERQAAQQEIDRIKREAEQAIERVRAGEDVEGGFAEAQQAVADEEGAQVSVQEAIQSQIDAQANLIEAQDSLAQTNKDLEEAIKNLEKAVTGDREEKPSADEGFDDPVTDTGRSDGEGSSDAPDLGDSEDTVSSATNVIAESLTNFATTLDDSSGVILSSANNARLAVDTFARRVEGIATQLTDDLPTVADKFETVVNVVNELQEDVEELNSAIEQLRG